MVYICQNKLQTSKKTQFLEKLSKVQNHWMQWFGRPDIRNGLDMYHLVCTYHFLPIKYEVINIYSCMQIYGGKNCIFLMGLKFQWKYVSREIIACLIHHVDYNAIIDSNENIHKSNNRKSYFSKMVMKRGKSCKIS